MSKSKLTNKHPGKSVMTLPTGEVLPPGKAVTIADDILELEMNARYLAPRYEKGWIECEVVEEKPKAKPRKSGETAAADGDGSSELTEK